MIGNLMRMLTILISHGLASASNPETAPTQYIGYVDIDKIDWDTVDWDKYGVGEFAGTTPRDDDFAPGTKSAKDHVIQIMKQTKLGSMMFDMRLLEKMEMTNMKFTTLGRLHRLSSNLLSMQLPPDTPEASPYGHMITEEDQNMQDVTDTLFRISFFKEKVPMRPNFMNPVETQRMAYVKNILKETDKYFAEKASGSLSHKYTEEEIQNYEWYKYKAEQLKKAHQHWQGTGIWIVPRNEFENNYWEEKEKRYMQLSQFEKMAQYFSEKERGTFSRKYTVGEVIDYEGFRRAQKMETESSQYFKEKESGKFSRDYTSEEVKAYEKHRKLREEVIADFERQRETRNQLNLTKNEKSTSVAPPNEELDAIDWQKINWDQFGIGEFVGTPRDNDLAPGTRTAKEHVLQQMKKMNMTPPKIRNGGRK